MAEQTTWIKVDRNIQQWRWYKDATTMRVFLHLLLNANVTDHDFESETIHRGEVAISIGHLAADLGITYSQARTAIYHLIDSKEIASRKRPKYLVITVLCYDKYQGIASKSHDASQANRKQIASKSQQYKNIRSKEEKKYIYTDYGGVFLTDEDWDELQGLVSDAGAFLEVIDRVGEWLQDNPRPKTKHKSVVRTFLRNDGLIK